jgi:hypothetical protein
MIECNHFSGNQGVEAKPTRMSQNFPYARTDRSSELGARPRPGVRAGSRIWEAAGKARMGMVVSGGNGNFRKIWMKMEM